MTFTLGMDIGVVMVKGVIFGVLACVTILPSMILCCDKLIVKTKHKPFCRISGSFRIKLQKISRICSDFPGAFIPGDLWK